MLLTRASRGRPRCRRWETRPTSPTCSTTDSSELAAVPTEAQPLLRVLLRHALLREYAEAGARALDAADLALLRDAELVDLVPGTSPTPTWSWTRGQTCRRGHRRRLVENDRAVAALKEALRDPVRARRAPRWNATWPRPSTAGSYRLDAWITSLATRRLAELRAARPQGLRVGGYGWVENLRPATPGPAVTDVPDEPGPLVAPANDPGFMHAPSLNQASAAALLRNAHLAHGGESDSPYAIELTSARVRLARHLFDGVRQGQPIGAVLGYTFERHLHDAGLDDLVDDFRALAPLPGASTPTGVRRLVVDGLVLARTWHDDPESVLASSDPRHEAAKKVLDALEAAVDAAADALNAEGAFQMVRGNVARAASSLDAVSSGQAPPPDLGFVRTPRTGTGLTHRVALFVDGGRAGEPSGLGTPVLLAAGERRSRSRRLGRSAARTRHRRHRPRRGDDGGRRGDRDPRRHAVVPGADPDRPGLGDRWRRRAASGSGGPVARRGRCHRPRGPLARCGWAR